VQYGQLVDIGREIVEKRVERPIKEKAVRWLLKEGLTSAAFGPAMKLGQWVRPWLPESLQNKIPAPAPSHAHTWPHQEHPRKVLILAGCVHPSMRPNINSATARVLDAAGIQTVIAPEAGCCGAIRTHLNDHEGGLQDMRRNIDAWWPHVQDHRVEAIVMNASGCGVTVKGYGQALAQDPTYADKARRISELTQDLSEMLPALVPLLRSKLKTPAGQRLAYHPPCTLQHGQKRRGEVEEGLSALGWDVRLTQAESHLCCGSAGTYSVLQPDIAYQLRDRKLSHLEPLKPEAIISANIGCIQHLQTGTEVPVKHWVEVIDEALLRP
jgi:glycolate oxidase iron-sulfur subunit